MKRIAQLGRAREHFATAPRAAKPRPPFTAHNDQTWKCIICGHEMKGKCNPNGSFHTASCWHCYTGFYVDADGTIAAYDLPKPLVRFRSWVSHLWGWWKPLHVVEPKPAPAPAPILDLNKEIARIEAEDRQSFAYNPTAIWLAPDRWDGPAGIPFG